MKMGWRKKEYGGGWIKARRSDDAARAGAAGGQTASPARCSGSCGAVNGTQMGRSCAGTPPREGALTSRRA